MTRRQVLAQFPIRPVSCKPVEVGDGVSLNILSFEMNGIQSIRNGHKSMSVIFGAYRQNGYVVPDLDKAIANWAAMGVGPFYRFAGLPIKTFSYGDSTEVPTMDVALGNFGEIQLELIQIRDGGVPSPYLDFITANPSGGLHHISTWSTDYEADLVRWAKAGYTPDCSGQVEGFAKFCYFRASRHDGTAIEVADAGTSDLLLRVSDLIHSAARTWDGTEPSRSPDELYTLLGA